MGSWKLGEICEGNTYQISYLGCGLVLVHREDVSEDVSRVTTANDASPPLTTVGGGGVETADRVLESEERERRRGPSDIPCVSVEMPVSFRECCARIGWDVKWLDGPAFLCLGLRERAFVLLREMEKSWAGGDDYTREARLVSLVCDSVRPLYDWPDGELGRSVKGWILSLGSEGWKHAFGVGMREPGDMCSGACLSLSEILDARASEFDVSDDGEEVGSFPRPRHSKESFKGFLSWLVMDANRAGSLETVVRSAGALMTKLGLTDWTKDKGVNR